MSDLDTQPEPDAEAPRWRVPGIGTLLVLAVFVIGTALLLGLYASQSGIRRVRALGGEVDFDMNAVSDLMTDFIDIDPELLATDADVHSIWLEGPEITDESLAVLRRFPTAIDVSIMQSGVTDHGLDQLSRATELIMLQIYDSPHITDAGIARLARLPRLHRLDLHGVPVTGEGIAALKHVRVLYLDACPQVDDTTLEYVGRLPNLTALSVADSAVTDAGLRHLAGLSQLITLTLDQTRITDEGLKTIVDSFPDLAYLSLDDVRGITDEGVLHLAALKSLSMLSLQSTNISKDAVDKLSQALPRCDVIHSSYGR